MNPITHIEKIIHHNQEGFIPGPQGGFNTCRLINMIHYTNKRKDKDAKKVFSKIQHIFVIKFSPKWV